MTIPKLLAQSLPAGATLTAFYTAPSGGRTYAQKLFVCNATAVATTFRVSMAVAGEADAARQYLYYDTALAANQTKALDLEVRLSAGDVLRIYTAGATVSFNLFGTEEI